MLKVKAGGSPEVGRTPGGQRRRHSIDEGVGLQPQAFLDIHPVD